MAASVDAKKIIEHVGGKSTLSGLRTALRV